MTTRMGATTPDEGTTAQTQHPPRHSEHLLAWGLWVLQWDDEGRALGAGQNTPGKVLCQYLDGIPKYVSILKKKDFDNILNN